jgi:hypothetical protein
MSIILEGGKDKDRKVMSSQEISEYLEDIAKDMGIDLSKDYDDKEIDKIFDKMTSLSDEILLKRGSKIKVKK